MATEKEIDRLVLKHVMEWPEWVNWQNEDYDGPYPMFMDDGDYLWVYHDPFSGNPTSIVSPSTDWGAAGMVVDKLVELGLHVEINACINGNHCFIYQDHQEERPMTYEGDTPQHAICIAALACMGVEHA